MDFGWAYGRNLMVIHASILYYSDNLKNSHSPANSAAEFPFSPFGVLPVAAFRDIDIDQSSQLKHGF